MWVQLTSFWLQSFCVIFFFFLSSPLFAETKTQQTTKKSAIPRRVAFSYIHPKPPEDPQDPRAKDPRSSKKTLRSKENRASDKISYRRPYPPRRKRETPAFLVDIGSAGAWLTAEGSHLALNFRALDLRVTTNAEKGKHLGFLFSLLEVENDGWREHATRPYDWLERFSWGRFGYLGRTGIFRFEGSFLSYRQLRWSLSDQRASLLPSDLPRQSFAPDALLILLPSLKLGIHLTPQRGRRFSLRLLAGFDVLQWDFQSLRAYLEGILHIGRGVRVRALGQYLQEQSLLLTEEKEGCRCTQAASWEHRSWEGRLETQLDLFSLFGGFSPKAKNPLWGPIFLDIGLRFRYVDAHRMITPTGRELFQEAVGGRLGFFFGLRIGIESNASLL
jgi:hypothetical protein